MESLMWRTSTRTSVGETCVECARAARSIALRDSKDRAGPHIMIDRSAFARLLDEIKGGKHDPLSLSRAREPLWPLGPQAGQGVKPGNGIP
jgi:hypothetical protein